MRRRAWWLRRSLGGWEAVIADLEALHDRDLLVAGLGRSPRPPMYFTPTAEQQSQVQALLADAALSRAQQLDIALAAGLRDLVADLRDQPLFQQSATRDDVVRNPDPVRPWWRRWRRS